MNLIWNADDAVSARDFIAKNPKFLAMLRSRVPKCVGATVEERAVTGSEAQGALNLIEFIEINMLASPHPTQKTEFVSHAD